MEKKLALRGMLLTLFGGTLWGFSGTCGQFLLQTKGLTSDWLVPIRLFFCGPGSGTALPGTGKKQSFCDLA